MKEVNKTIPNLAKKQEYDDDSSSDENQIIKVLGERNCQNHLPQTLRKTHQVKGSPLMKMRMK